MSWGAVAGAAVSVIGGSIMGGGSDRADAGQQQGQADYGAAVKDRALADTQRTSAEAGWTSATGAADKGQLSYDALKDLGQEELTLWRNEGIPLLRELGLKMADETDRTAEEEGIAANNAKTQAAVGRQNTMRALELGGNPSDGRYADTLASTFGREAADVSQAITTARRAERDRLAGVDQTNWNRKKAIADVYGGLAKDAAGNLVNAGAGSGRTAAIYANMAGSKETAAGASDSRAYTESQGGYSAIDKGLQAQDEANAQFGYTAGNLAERAAKKWFGAIDPTGGGSGADPNFGFDPASLNLSFGTEYADGGAIKGPGTGTSDSVSAIKKPGTYVLSADTVRAIGHKKLNDLMDKAGARPGMGGDDDTGGVPVRLSNGEWSMPPKVTQYYGEEFFHKLQQKHHRPVFSEDGMANGGAIRKRALPTAVEDAIFANLPTKAIGRR